MDTFSCYQSVKVAILRSRKLSRPTSWPIKMVRCHQNSWYLSTNYQHYLISKLLPCLKIGEVCFEYRRENCRILVKFWSDDFNNLNTKLSLLHVVSFHSSCQVWWLTNRMRWLERERDAPTSSCWRMSAHLKFTHTIIYESPSICSKLCNLPWRLKLMLEFAMVDKLYKENLNGMFSNTNRFKIYQFKHVLLERLITFMWTKKVEIANGQERLTFWMLEKA